MNLLFSVEFISDLTLFFNWLNSNLSLSLWVRVNLRR